MGSNPFVGADVARRYRRGRPYYHPTALHMARELLHRPVEGGTFELAVDLACGTGLSTRALLGHATHVVALDLSPGMLGQAEPLPGVHYLNASAEHLPLAGGVADFATVGAAFHWFDQTRAGAELARVLRPGAALAVYTDAFHGRLKGRPDFTTWFEGTYLRDHPGPPRHAYFPTELTALPDFHPARHAREELVVPLTRTELTDYLLSQSNAITAIDAGSTTQAVLRDLLSNAIASVIPDDEQVAAVFEVRVWVTTRR